MTVKDLMAFLEHNADPADEVVIAREGYAMGSDETGVYECGIELHKIEKAKFVKADTFAGLDELEQIDRVELTEDDD